MMSESYNFLCTRLQGGDPSCPLCGRYKWMVPYSLIAEQFVCEWYGTSVWYSKCLLL